MNITCIIFGIAFFAIGAAFFAGKAHMHITAWKAMPEDEKEKIKIIPLCRNIGMAIMLCAVIFLTGGVWTLFRESIFVWAMIIWLVLAGADVYYIDKSNRYVKR